MRRLPGGLVCGLALALIAAPGAVAAVGPLVTVTGQSPFAAACNGAAQPGTEYRGAEVEPWVESNPAAPGHLLGVWQQDRYSDGGANGLGTGISRDGGATWSVLPVASLPKFTRCQGATAGSDGDYERASDPWLSFGPDGHAYQIALAINQARDGANAILVSESTDGGTGWGPVTVLKRDTVATRFNDKETITADRTDARYVYAVWDRLATAADGLSYTGPTWFARTSNGGASWETARVVLDTGVNGQTVGNRLVVMPDGALLNGYLRIDRSATLPRLEVMRSTNKGASFSSPIVVGTAQSVGVRDPRDGQPVRTGDIVPQIASDERGGTNVAYMVWQDSRFTAGARDQIALSRSTDGGLTWSPARRVSTRAETQAFTAAVRVDASGNVAITHYDFRNDAPGTPALETDVWLLHSTDGGQTFTEERVTPTSFDMRAAAVARGYFVGDYTGLAAEGADFKPFFAITGGSGGGPSDVVGALARAPFGTAPAPAPQAAAAAGARRPARARLRLSSRGVLRRGAAYLRYRCAGPPCRGILRLTAVRDRGGPRRPILLGSRSFRTTRARGRLKLRLSRRAARLVGGATRLVVRAEISNREDRSLARIVLRAH